LAAGGPLLPEATTRERTGSEFAGNRELNESGPQNRRERAAGAVDGRERNGGSFATAIITAARG
jgi:hypothetical protein